MNNIDHDAMQAGEGDNGINALIHSIVPVHVPEGSGGGQCSTPNSESRARHSLQEQNIGCGYYYT